MRGMEILKGIEIKGKALWLRKQSILVISDLHIGYEQALNEQGMLTPRTQFKEMMNDLKKVFDEIEKGHEKVKKVVVLGDLKHEFGGISRQEWRESLAVLDFLKGKCKKIVLIKGNHDMSLDPIARQKNVRMRDFYISKDACFMHGHKMFAGCLGKKIKTIVLGHRHPAFALRDRAKSESYKCFLAGKWKGRQIIIMPSFFPLVEGSDVMVEGTNLAMKLNLSNFKVYVVADKVYDFGRVKKTGRLGVSIKHRR